MAIRSSYLLKEADALKDTQNAQIMLMSLQELQYGPQSKDVWKVFV